MAALRAILSLCGGGGHEEKQELKEKAADAPTVQTMFNSLSNRVLTAVGREPPDVEFDSSVKVLAEERMLKLVLKGSGPELARFVTSPDGSMLMWTSVELQANMPKFSGAVPLASITRVEQPTVSALGAWISAATGHMIVVYHSTPSEQIRIEVSDERLRNEWATALDVVSTKKRTRHAAAKSERGVARHAQKELEMMSKRKEAERRKADILGSMKSGGMKHTAIAMASK